MTDRAIEYPDALSELVPAARLAKQLPRGLDGNPIGLRTILRWCRRGIGGVRLESRRIGGRVYTSRRALDRFMEALDSKSVRA